MLEDKIVQRAYAEVVGEVFEAEFLGFSYGFRPGRSQHDAQPYRATHFGRRHIRSGQLDPLPCWKHLTTAQRRRKVAEMIAEVEAEAAALRRASGAQVLGIAAVQAQDPLDRPARLKKTRRPLVHAASKVERESYLVVRGVFGQTAISTGRYKARVP